VGWESLLCGLGLELCCGLGLWSCFWLWSWLRNGRGCGDGFFGSFGGVFVEEAEDAFSDLFPSFSMEEGDGLVGFAIGAFFDAVTTAAFGGFE